MYIIHYVMIITGVQWIQDEIKRKFGDDTVARQEETANAGETRPTPTISLKDFTNKKAKLRDDTSTTDLSELSMYLRAPNCDASYNPLVYWKEHQHVYPQLYEVSIFFKP
jgi:hypothetical protein